MTLHHKAMKLIALTSFWCSSIQYGAQSSPVPFSSPQDIALPLEELNQETIVQETPEQTRLAALFQQQLDNTMQLDALLSDILIQCGNNSIRTSNSAEHVQALTNIRDTIEEKTVKMQPKALVQSTGLAPEDVADLLAFNESLASALETLITSHFKEPIHLPKMRSIDVASSSDNDADLEALEALAQEFAQQFEKIKKAATQAGLTWYNKLYRKVRPWTVAPAIKHASWEKMALFAAASTAYVVWESSRHDLGLFDPRPSLTKRVIARVKDFVGNGPKRHQITTSQGDELEYSDGPSSADTNLGKIVAWLEYFLNPNKRVAGFLYGSLFAGVAGKYGEFSPKIKQKLTDLDNFLLGGVHRNQKLVNHYIPTTRLKDVVGMDEEKRLAEIIIQSALNPEPFARAGATPPVTVLCIGGSRSGKTHFAEAIGGEIGARSGSDAYFLRVTPQLLIQFGFEGLLDIAKHNNIRVLFIDEFHRYFKHAANQDLLNGALSALNQQYDPKFPVLIICATNDPASLPQDLRNRFEVTIRFSATTLNDRAAFLQKELQKTGVKIDDSNFAEFIRATEGCSFETLQRLIKAAKRSALIAHEAVSIQHLYHALDTSIRGIIFDSSKTLSPQARQLIAMNIAGETLISLLEEAILEREVSAATTLPYNAQIQETSLINQAHLTNEMLHDHRYVGRVYSHSLYDTTQARSYEQLHSDCKVLLAGQIAEELLAGKCSYSYRPQSYEQALKIALAIVSKGIDLNKITPEVKAHYEREALEYIKQVSEEVKQALTEQIKKLALLTSVLFEHQLLYRGDILLLTSDATLQQLEETVKAQGKNPIE